MAKVKMLKYPKKPKASASVATKENYLAKVREIDKENSRRKAENEKSKKLDKQIAGIGKTTSLFSRPKRKATSKKSTAKRTTKKKTTRRKR